MNRQDREYMNDLSKKAFGTSSRWQKILLHGVIERYEKDHPIITPHANGRGFQQTTVKKYENQLRRYTQNELMALMIGIIDKRKADLAKVMDSFQKDTAVQAQVNVPGLPDGATVTMTDASGAVTTAVNNHAPSVQGATLTVEDRTGKVLETKKVNW